MDDMKIERRCSSLSSTRKSYSSVIIILQYFIAYGELFNRTPDQRVAKNCR